MKYLALIALLVVMAGCKHLPDGPRPIADCMNRWHNSLPQHHCIAERGDVWWEADRR